MDNILKEERDFFKEKTEVLETIIEYYSEILRTIQEDSETLTAAQYEAKMALANYKKLLKRDPL